MRPDTRHGEAGFTFVETLFVGVVVFVLLSGVTLVFMDTGARVWATTETQLVTLESAKRALHRLSAELREASRTNLSCNVGGVDVAFDPIPAQAEGVAPPRVSYWRDTNTGSLMRQDQGADPTVAVAGLTDFTVTCPAAELVRLEVTARFATPHRAATQTLTSYVRLLNP